MSRKSKPYINSGRIKIGKSYAYTPERRQFYVCTYTLEQMYSSVYGFTSISIYTLMSPDNPILTACTAYLLSVYASTGIYIRTSIITSKQSVCKAVQCTMHKASGRTGIPVYKQCIVPLQSNSVVYQCTSVPVYQCTGTLVNWYTSSVTVHQYTTLE